MIVQHGWHPVAASTDLPVGHIYRSQLCDRPLAIWRAPDGAVNIWEDRCPHRGVRLSIGSVHGDELRCQYHAWRFKSGSGGCTTIPAHPNRRPAAAIRASVFPVIERDGLIWSRLAGDQDEPPVLPPAGVVLRAVPVNCSAETIRAVIEAAPLPGMRLLVQPVSETRAIIRGIANDAGLLVEHDAALERLRHVLEAA